MAETQIDVEIGTPPTEIDARVGTNATPIDAAIAVPSTNIDAAIAIAPTAIDASVVSVATLIAELLQPPIQFDAPVVIAPTQIEAEVGGVSTFDLAAVEFAAAKNRSDAIKLASSTLAFDLGSFPGTFIELPTGLILHPRFVDSGYIEVTFSCSHVGAGETFSYRVLIGPRGGAFVTIGPITSPAIAANALASQFDVAMRIKNHGSVQAQWVSWFVYSAGAGPTTQTPVALTQRVTGVNFDNVANGDDGDLEIRVEASVSLSTNFLVRNYLINQFGVRDGVWC